MPEAYDTTAILARLDAIERTLGSGTLQTPALAAPYLTPASDGIVAAVRQQFVPAVDVRHFGVTLTALDQRAPKAVARANTEALGSALEWSARTGGAVHLPSGSLDLWGVVELPRGASIRGAGKFSSRIRQLCQPASDAEPFVDVFAAPAVSGGIGGNGYNIVADLTIDGGWNLRNHSRDGNGNWHYDPARMTQRGLVFATPAGGPLDAAVRDAGSDAHGRIENVCFTNIAGYGFQMSGRGENFARGVEIRKTGKSAFLIQSPDCFLSDLTCYLTGDSGVEIRAGAGNLRWTNSKVWFCGMQRAVQGIGAAIHLPDPGTETIMMNNISTQDSWGPGLQLNGNVGIVFSGDIDEAGGGRLEQQGFGWRGTRSLPRAFIRAPGTLRRARITAQIKGGSRLGEAARPALVDLSGSGVGGCVFRLGGSLDHVATPPVRVSTGHVNAGRYNEIWFEDRLLHGQVTAKELNTAGHGVNDPVYGPSRAYRNDGRLMVRGPAGWIQQK